ncbi:5'-nucleotidase C-terminal domain-containing protein [Sphingobacterium alkalisoli]|uniref:5'-nucleotidase C-terminal domain-containing protein n=1 Tax=Sphingobacterium alkalisoli TaxID=1874115 RepID=UPI001E593936|nr:5'-nucleotidase C-terminal domain-containing protein [Sphingobacterium alkalisoli]
MRNVHFLSIFIIVLLAGCKSTYLARENRLMTYTINSDLPEDTAIVNYYSPFKKTMEGEMNRQIGISEKFLNKSRSEPEFLIGNFFADALLEIGKKIDPAVEISFSTKGGIRSELKQGAVTVGSMFELMPFENTITLLDISGSDLLVLADFIANTGGQPIGGFTMKIKDNQVITIRLNGKAIDPAKSYKLVTYDYLANGGDNVKGLSTPLKRINTSILVREGLINYVEQLTKENKKINTQLDGRISIIQ